MSMKSLLLKMEQQNGIERKKNLKSQNPLQRVLYKNIDSTADAIVQVMTICCIPECKAINAKPIIVKALINFERVCYRVDRLPKKRISKKSFIYNLTNRSDLSLKEITLTYSITSRVFNAFYFATTECGLFNKEIEAHYNHNRECFWVHAAKRTAQIFAAYEGVFHNKQKLYEERIKCVYKHLNDLINYRCGQCTKKTVVHSKETSYPIFFETNLLAQKSQMIFDTIPFEESTESTSENNEDEVQIRNCNCPKLECYINTSDEFGTLSWEGSQGPFICRWTPLTDEEPFKDICATICKSQIQCVEPSIHTTESEFEYNNEDVYECQEEAYEDIFEEYLMETDAWSKETITPAISSDFSCHIPSCIRQTEIEEEIDMHLVMDNNEQSDKNEEETKQVE